jgi:hypothetical protein
MSTVLNVQSDKNHILHHNDTGWRNVTTVASFLMQKMSKFNWLFSVGVLPILTYKNIVFCVQFIVP